MKKIMSWALLSLTFAVTAAAGDPSAAVCRFEQTAQTDRYEILTKLANPADATKAFEALSPEWRLVGLLPGDQLLFTYSYLLGRIRTPSGQGIVYLMHSGSQEDFRVGRVKDWFGTLLSDAHSAIALPDGQGRVLVASEFELAVLKPRRYLHSKDKGLKIAANVSLSRESLYQGVDGSGYYYSYGGFGALAGTMPDGSVIAGSDDGSIFAITVEEERRTFRTDRFEITPRRLRLAESKEFNPIKPTILRSGPNGPAVVAVSRKGYVYILDQRLRLTRQFKIQTSSEVVDFDPPVEGKDGGFVIVSREDWDKREGKKTVWFFNQEGNLAETHVAIGPSYRARTQPAYQSSGRWNLLENPDNGPPFLTVLDATGRLAYSVTLPEGASGPWVEAGPFPLKDGNLAFRVRYSGDMIPSFIEGRTTCAP